MFSIPFTLFWGHKVVEFVEQAGMLRVRFPMESLGISIDLILPAAA
jgi:hypothetical protein